MTPTRPNRGENSNGDALLNYNTLAAEAHVVDIGAHIV